MAQEVVGIKIQVDGGAAAKSVGTIKQQIKESELALIDAQKQFGNYSKEAIQAAKRVAELKDSVKEAAETADLFDPGKKFQAFAGALSTVAGGFTAVQGALGLVGVESENVEKSLLKVQSALALSQGLSTIADSVKDFERLGAIIKNVSVFQRAYNAATVAAAAIQRAFGVAVTTTSVAFKALRAAIITTGIGALVIGVGLLVDKIMDWVNSASAAEKAQEKLAASTKKMNGEIDNQISVLTALGNKEEQIYQLRLKRNENELNVLRNKLKTQGKLSEEELAQFRKLKTDKEVLDIQEQNRIKKNQEEEAKKVKDENQKRADEAAKAREAEIAFEEGLERRREERLKERLDSINGILNTYEKQDEERKKLAEEKEKERVQKEKDLFNTRIQNNLASLRQRVNDTNKANQEQIESDRAAAESRAAIQDAYINLAGQVGGFLKQIAGKNKTLQIAGIVAEQAASVARIISGIAVANAKSVAASPLTAGQPFVAINTASGVLSIASTIAAAAKGISQVKGSDNSQSIGGATLPSATKSAPIAPVEPLINTRTQLDSQTIQQLGSATNRAYVVESDVTNSQERIRRINRAARLS